MQLLRKLIRKEVLAYLEEQQKLQEMTADEKKAQVKADQANLAARKAALDAAQKKLRDTQAATTD